MPMRSASMQIRHDEPGPFADPQKIDIRPTAGAKSRERFETAMIEKKDTHFCMGSLHQFPNAWIVVGLIYTPHETTRDMFFK
jgi:hypothetical protein